MPSLHAQFVAFFSVYLTLFLLVRHTPRAPFAAENKCMPVTWSERLIVSLLAIFGAGMVAVSRVYLNYHTPYQVAVGVIAGTALAISWFTTTSLARSLGLVDWILNLKVMKAMRIRDLVVHEDFVDAGWQHWQQLTIRSASKKTT